MTEDERLHLQFIQNVITRMNTNSFQIKTFTISFSAALLTLCINSRNHFYALFGLISVISFYAFDAYYLQQERKYRILYNDAVKRNVPLYEMNLQKYNINTFDILFSKTIFPFYFLPIVILACLFFAYF